MRRHFFSLKAHWLRRGVLLAVVIGALAFLRGCALRPGNDLPGAYFNKGTNAVWLGVEWVNEARTPDEIKALADVLASLQIRYVYAYTTYLKDSGVFNPTYAHATAFIRALKQAQPSLVVLAWIGLPLKTGYGYVDVSNAHVRQQIVALAAELVNHIGFDGIHINAGIIYSGDRDVLQLWDDLRPVIGTKLLSVTGQSAQPLFTEMSLLGVALGWRGDYLRETAARVDQIAVMTYDSGITAGATWLYRLWMRFQVIGITRALANADVEVLLGIPTSEEWTLSHDPTIESMGNGLQGLLDGLNDHEAIPAVIDGVAIYPAWETDDAEWQLNGRMWLGQ